MKHFIYILLILPFVFLSCEKQDTVNSNLDDTRMSNTDTADVYYEPVADKNLAIILRGNIDNTTTSWLDSLSIIRNKLGFSYLFIYSDKSWTDPYLAYTKAVQAGFLPSELFYQLSPRSDGKSATLNRIDSLFAKGVRMFYLYEPLESERAVKLYDYSKIDYMVSKSDILDYAYHIHTRGPDGKLYISSNIDFTWVVRSDSTSDEIAKAYYDIEQTAGNVWIMNDSYAAPKRVDIWKNYYANYLNSLNQHCYVGNLIDDKFDYVQWPSYLAKTSELELSFLVFYNCNLYRWSVLKQFCATAARNGWLTIKAKPDPVPRQKL